ncbi:MAG: AMP-binding protein [Polyangiaceae bacterium]|nr:AMP-binding protein [Polyangiaceae bacterium]
MTLETQLDYAQHWEKDRPNDIWFTQPLGGGKLRELTFEQAMDEVRRMAAHLVGLGLPEKSNIALFSKNTAWWILADLAIWMAGHTSVPLYPTLTAETIRQILEHSEAKLIFIGKLDGFPAMEPGIPPGLPRIALPLSPKLDAPTWDAIIAKSAPLAGEIRRPKTDLATIIYTSGSTGVPKGVMHSFETMISPGQRFTEYFELRTSDRMLSYLPLAHAFERYVVETGTIGKGFHVFFAESLDTFVEDIKRARPTLFVSVPRLWQKFQLGVFSKMPERKLGTLLKIPIVSGIIKKKVLSGLGFDQVRIAGSGSAPIPAELISWYRSLGLELLEGYGMSENFSYSHMTLPGDVRVGYVGKACDGVECKLSPEGEVLVKSPGTMLGYYKAPELTAEMFTEDGFLKTGDRGELDADGRLKITGRVKELFKTSKGKYVAPAPIENKLLLHSDVEQALVTGNGFPQPYGMVVLSEQARKRVSDAAERQQLASTLESHLSEVNATLDQHEQLDLLVVVSDEWTIENGLLTPTMKLKRSAIETKYGELAPSWYEEKKPVVWA